MSAVTKSLIGVALSLLVLSGISCGRSEHQTPAILLTGELPQTEIDSVSDYFRALAHQHSLRVFEKPEAEMRTLTRDMKAFYISAYTEADDEIVFYATNAGAGTQLVVGLIANRAVDSASADQIEEQIVIELKALFDIDLTREI